jgi:hypothetical protein
VQVGNGGFSLRRISACLSLFAEFPETRGQFLDSLRRSDATHLHEDLFFSVGGSQSLHFKTPNERVASTFSLEGLPEWYFKANGGRCIALPARQWRCPHVSGSDAAATSASRRRDRCWDLSRRIPWDVSDPGQHTH